jgi:hypothetical protein
MLITPNHDGRVELQIRGEDDRRFDCHTKLVTMTTPSLKPYLNAHALITLASGKDDRISHQALRNWVHKIFRAFLQLWSNA